MQLHFRPNSPPGVRVRITAFDILDVSHANEEPRLNATDKLALKLFFRPGWKERLMPDRREFIKTVAGFGAAAALPATLLAAPLRAQRLHFGSQTNAWGNPVKTYDHLREILDALAAAGYAGFETNHASLDGLKDKAAECRQAFESRHVQLIAPHCSVVFFDQGKVESELPPLLAIARYSAQMGATHLIVSGRRLPHTDGKLDLAAAHAKAAGLNQLGEAVKKEGLKLCYHNHVQEFEDDPSEMSILLAETHPKTVWLNYDIGNAYPQGPDPATFSQEHFRRIAIYHIKDERPIDPNAPAAPSGPGPGAKRRTTESCALGEGKINLAGVVAPLLKSNWKGWLTVEREGNYPHGVEDPPAAVKQCRDYLRKITGV